MMENLPYRRIGIVGTGRVARALGLALASHTEGPVTFWGRDRARAQAAAATAGGVVARQLGEVVEGCDIIVLAVSDDAISAVVAMLARAAMPSPPPFIFHVSGGSGADPLEPLRAVGAFTAAIHPAMTFIGDPQAEMTRMAGARFAITGSSAAATERARALVTHLGGVAEAVEEDRRALYHAALCHAANHMVTLLSGASHALSAAGVAEPGALLAPLARAALENSLSEGFEALSGPLLRGDAQTIVRHLAALSDGCPQLLPAYRAMARATLDELDRTGAPPATALRDLLG